MSTKDNLATALDLINEGWTKGSVYNDGCYCLLGALAAARTGLRRGELREWHYTPSPDSSYEPTPEVELVAKAVAAEFPGRVELKYPVDQVYRFNDHEDTEKEDVVRVLTKAIEAAGE